MLLHIPNYAPDGWVEKGAPMEIVCAAHAMKNTSMHPTEFKQPPCQKILDKNNLYDLMLEKIPQNDTVALARLATQGDIHYFWNGYNFFKDLYTKNHTQISIAELVPDTELGLAAAQARNHLAQGLTDDVPTYYRKCTLIPEEEDVRFMDQAVALSLAVLTDPSMDMQHPVKQTALDKVSAILVANNTKSEQLSVMLYNPDDSNHTLSKEDFEKDRAHTIARLSVAEMRVLELMDNPEHTVIAEAIFAQRDAQIAAQEHSMHPHRHTAQKPTMQF